MILPATDDPDSAPFWAAAREGRLIVQESEGRLIFPPRPGQPNAGWRQVSGRGTIWSHITVHGPTLPAYADLVPFPVVIVELEEAPHLRMVGNLIAEPGAPINSLAPQEIEVGQRVRVSFERIADDVALPCWVPEPLSRKRNAISRNPA